MAGTGRFIALTTDDKRAMLERAWRDAPNDADSLMEELQKKRDEVLCKQSDGVQNMSANGHSAGTFYPGQDAPSNTEIARGYTELIDMFRRMKIFLKACARYGLDCWTVRHQATFPNPLPDSLPDDQRVVVESDIWDTLCDRYDIDEDKVVGQVVGDEAIYLFMLVNLFPVTESRADYGEMITGRGGMQYT